MSECIDCGESQTNWNSKCACERQIEKDLETVEDDQEYHPIRDY